MWNVEGKGNKASFNSPPSTEPIPPHTDSWKDPLKSHLGHKDYK